MWVTTCSLDTGPTAGHSSQHVFVGLLLGREKRDGEKDQGRGQMGAWWKVGEGSRLLRFQFPTPTGAAVHVARQEKHLKKGVRSQVSGVQVHPTQQAQREKSPAQMRAWTLSSKGT